MVRERDPEKTRNALLQAAFEEIHRFGFQSASLDNILKKAEVTKGAMYHHFPNKSALGIAVIEEILAPTVQQEWQHALEATDDPLSVIIEKIQSCDAENMAEHIELGCPLNNLAQEMSALDETFREALMHIFKQWQSCIADALVKGQQAGNVRQDINPSSTALFIVSAFEGCISIIKTSKSIDVMQACGQGLIDYLNSLRT